MERSNFVFVPSSLTIILNLLPIISFSNFFFQKVNFETIPISRIVSNYIISISFFFYSSIIFNIEMRFAYLTGGIISLILMLIYFYLELSRYLLDAILNFILLIIGTLVSYQWLSKIIIEEKIVGMICVLTNISSIIVQLSYIYNGIVKKNYMLIPITYDSVSFPGYCSWVIYGIIIGDYYILVANLIPCFDCTVNILLYFYYRKYFINNEENENSIEIDEETKKEFSSLKEIKERPVKIENSS